MEWIGGSAAARTSIGSLSKLQRKTASWVLLLHQQATYFSLTTLRCALQGYSSTQHSYLTDFVA